MLTNSEIELHRNVFEIGRKRREICVCEWVKEFDLCMVEPG
jgi:hypothetical protein